MSSATVSESRFTSDQPVFCIHVPLTKILWVNKKIPFFLEERFHTFCNNCSYRFSFYLDTKLDIHLQPALLMLWPIFLTSTLVALEYFHKFIQVPSSLTLQRSKFLQTKSFHTVPNQKLSTYQAFSMLTIISFMATWLYIYLFHLWFFSSFNRSASLLRFWEYICQ